MMTTVTTCLLMMLTVFVVQQLVLAIAGLTLNSKKQESVHQHRKIAVFLFSERMESNLRQMLLQLVHQEYPAEKFTVHLVTSDRKNLERYADLPIKVLLTYDTNKVVNCRQALEQTEGVFDIAVSIHQPLHITEKYLTSVNEGFQQGSYFMQPWISRAENTLEIVPEPEAGFQALKVSVPLNNSIYSTPFLWLKQQLEQMKDLENYHHGLQYRLLEQGNMFRLIPGITATLNEDATTEKKGLINRLEFGLRGFKLLLTGKPSMFFIGTWKFQPSRIVLIPALMAAAVLQPVFTGILAIYFISCGMIMVKHPQLAVRKSVSNFRKQFGLIPVLTRKKRTALSVSTAE